MNSTDRDKARVATKKTLQISKVRQRPKIQGNQENNREKENQDKVQSNIRKATSPQRSKSHNTEETENASKRKVPATISRNSRSTSNSPQNAQIIRSTRTSRLRATALAKSSQCPLNPQKTNTVQHLEERLKSKDNKLRSATTQQTNVQKIESASVKSEMAVPSQNISREVSEQKRGGLQRKLSVPSIASMQINQTLSDFEVTLDRNMHVKQRSSSASSAIYGQPHKLRKVAVSPHQSDTVNGDSHRSFAKYTGYLKRSGTSPKVLVDSDKDKSLKRKSNLNRTQVPNVVSDDVVSVCMERRRQIAGINFHHSEPSSNEQPVPSRITSSATDMQRKENGVSIKSSFQDDTKLGVEDNKFNKMLKSPTLEAHPRLEKKIRLMGSRSLDRSSIAMDEQQPHCSSSSIKKSEENVVEVLKYLDDDSNDAQQLMKGAMIYIEKDDDEMVVPKQEEVIESVLPPVEDVVKSQRKSEPDHLSNHIISILKRKDDSSSSSNTSPVTFSPSVIDTPIRNSGKQGILKKRSSLDESRYSRSHSPDERNLAGNRRNSLEETHGILKQPSCDKEDTFTNSHGILKKKESITPSGEPKHVSIAQAVILAAAEICQDISEDDRRYDIIKPILKQDSHHITGAPKPILKKKHSSEGEELRAEETVRPILKSSRKSSRDENYSDTDNEYSCGSSLSSGTRSILKTDSPAKRRSLNIESFDGILQRSKSLENPDPVSHNSPETMELPLVSVLERVRHMERTINAGGAIPKQTLSNRRDRERFMTHPVTLDDLNSARTTSKYINENFKQASLNVLSENECKSSPSAALSLNNLGSLSSDSGIQFGKMSSEMSASGDNTPKSSSNSESSIKNETKELHDDDKKEKNNENKKSDAELLSTLKRSNSVKARANMFQKLESNQCKKDIEKPPKRVPPLLPRVESDLKKPVKPTIPAIKPLDDDDSTVKVEKSDTQEPELKGFREKIKFFSGLSSVPLRKQDVLVNNNNDSNKNYMKILEVKENAKNDEKTNEIRSRDCLNHNNNNNNNILTVANNIPKQNKVGKLNLPKAFNSKIDDVVLKNNENLIEQPPRKIGRVKSIFLDTKHNTVDIENDEASDSSKENYYTYRKPMLQQEVTPETIVKNAKTPTRRKLARNIPSSKTNGTFVKPIFEKMIFTLRQKTKKVQYKMVFDFAEIEVTSSELENAEAEFERLFCCDDDKNNNKLL